MKMQNTMPTQGQFVAVWEYNGNIWSSIYKWEDGELCAFVESIDDFLQVHESESPFQIELESFKATYLVH